MKQGQYIKEEKLLKQGVDILMEKLGPIDELEQISNIKDSDPVFSLSI